MHVIKFTELQKIDIYIYNLLIIRKFGNMTSIISLLNWT